MLPAFSVFDRCSLFFRCFQLFELCAGFGGLVETVERVTTRRQSISWRGRAIAEGSAHSLAIGRPAFQHVAWKFGIGQNHSSQPDRIDPSITHRRLSYVRQ